MSIPLLIGGQILGGLFGARSARKAAQTQADATREGIASQERMFERQLGLQEPFRQGGLEAQNMLMQELRNPSQYQASAGLAPGDIAQQRFQQSAGLSPAEIAGERFQASAGLSPAEIANRQFQQTQGLSPGELGTEQFNFQADPGYGFRMSEGLKALERSAAARGGLMAGGTGKALQRYGQDMASQEYGNAFQRFQQDRAARAGLGQMEYGRFADEQGRRAAAGMQEFGQFTDLMGRRAAAGQTEYGRFADDMSRRQGLGAMEYGQFAGERSARLLPLMQQAQSGQGLTSNIAGQMANLGAAQAGAAGQIGAAQAAGRMGSANALAGAVGQGANLYMQGQQNQMFQNYLNSMRQPMSYGYAGSYGQGSL
jgi:hypothetical protein